MISNQPAPRRLLAPSCILPRRRGRSMRVWVILVGPCSSGLPQRLGKSARLSPYLLLADEQHAALDHQRVGAGAPQGGAVGLAVLGIVDASRPAAARQCEAGKDRQAYQRTRA